MAKNIKRLSGVQWIEVEVAFNDAFVKLLSNDVDAFFFVGATPVEKLSKLSRGVKKFIKMVAIDDKALSAVYSPVKVKAGTYRWVEGDVNTYAVKSVLGIATLLPLKLL